MHAAVQGMGGGRLGGGGGGGGARCTVTFKIPIQQTSPINPGAVNLTHRTLSPSCGSSWWVLLGVEVEGIVKLVMVVRVVVLEVVNTVLVLDIFLIGVEQHQLVIIRLGSYVTCVLVYYAKSVSKKQDFIGGEPITFAGHLRLAPLLSLSSLNCCHAMLNGYPIFLR